MCGIKISYLTLHPAEGQSFDVLIFYIYICQSSLSSFMLKSALSLVYRFVYTESHTVSVVLWSDHESILCRLPTTK